MGSSKRTAILKAYWLPGKRLAQARSGWTCRLAAIHSTAASHLSCVCLAEGTRHCAVHAKLGLSARTFSRSQGKQPYRAPSREEHRVFGIPQISDHDIFGSLDGIAGVSSFYQDVNLRPAGRASPPPPPPLRRPSSATTTNETERPGLRAWSETEEQRLLCFVKKTYAGEVISWDKVAVEFDRTGVGCMAKYYSLLEALADHEQL
ncbi:hypothetical protein GGH95_001213 [Coemansia sp. RSA 1836]|nr:hypothetical protein GGH95_001213 [Coemansia sp. RSA 1836]